MKNLMFLTVAVFSFVLMANTSVQAQWVKLGERAVNFRADHDEIPVTVLKGTFKKVKMSVHKAPIYLKNVRIIYGNGESTNIVVNKRIPAGTESAAFDLPGKNRIIKKINFNYKSVPTFRGRGRIEAFGKH